MKKETRMLIVLGVLLIIGCSSSIIINKGNNNKINADINTEPKTHLDVDGLNILSSTKNKQRPKDSIK